MKTAKTWLLIVMALALSQTISAMQLRDFSDKPTDLQSHLAKDKWTVVVFWSHSCSICRRETPALTQFHLKHRDKDAQVIGVSIDGAKNKHKAEAFMQQTDMGFESLIGELIFIAADFYQITGEAFRGTPSYLLYNPKGELLGMQAGPVRVEALESFLLSNTR